MPTNGQLIGLQRKTGDTIRFECDLGYNIAGDSYAICQQNGAWTSPTPTCQGKKTTDFMTMYYCCRCYPAHVSITSNATSIATSIAISIAISIVTSIATSIAISTFTSIAVTTAIGIATNVATSTATSIATSIAIQ